MTIEGTADKGTLREALAEGSAPTRDDFATLTQRAAEAEEAWARRLAAEKAWEQAAKRLLEAWVRVRAEVEPPVSDD